LYLAELQQTCENLTTDLGKILRKCYEVSKIGPLNTDCGNKSTAVICGSVFFNISWKLFCPLHILYT